MRHNPTPRRRGGFTLIELLVAAALSLVVMTVLSLAFQTGMQTLSQLKSVVGMAEQLRAAETAMRRDLQAGHLEDLFGRQVRVSAFGAEPVSPRGYVMFAHTFPVAVAGSLALPEAPTGASDLPLSFRSANDALMLTVGLAGDTPSNTFTARAADDDAVARRIVTALRSAGGIPAELAGADTDVSSKWAEVSYFVRPNNQYTSDEGGAAAPALPLYTLYRRQRLVLPKTIDLTSLLAPADIALINQAGIAVVGTSVVGLPDIRTPANRLNAGGLPLPPIPAGNSQYGSDVLLNNVVSMTVRPVYAITAINTRISGPAPQAATPDPRTNPLFYIPGSGAVDYQPRLMPQIVSAATNTIPVDIVANTVQSFDTAGSGGVFVLRSMNAGNGTFGSAVGLADAASPQSFIVKALELKIRVYDSKNKTTRQMTVLVDL